MYSAEQIGFMSQAVQLARRGEFTARPNPSVGCVIVNNQKIVGSGWHGRAGSAHAEIHALNKAGESARGADCYVTLEPCAHHGKTGPCVEALIQAGVARVFAAMQDPNPLVSGKGLQRLRDAGISVSAGLLESEAQLLNRGFVRRMSAGLPFVRAKSAMSLDGRTAMASGESRWISGAAARQDVQQWRARSGAILTGVNTILKDNPRLTVRNAELMSQIPAPPLRVVLDSDCRMPEHAALFAEAGHIVLFHAPAQQHPLAGGAEECVAVARDANGLDLRAVLEWLAQREINDVLLEAGATLTGAMLAAGLVDEWVIYVAPKIIGDSGVPLARLPGLSKLEEALNFTVVDTRVCGQDWRFTLRPINPAKP